MKYIVEMEDLSNLGGPMGTEYTESLGTRMFSSRAKAVSFCRKLAEKGMVKIPTFNQDRLYDCGYIGLKLRKAKKDWH